jgi:RNA polymerase sigma-70 factor (ECF subfamily)
VNDEQLVERAIAGDESCFGELVLRWQGKIYNFVYRYLGDREEARDLTQNTFVKAYRSVDRLSDPTRFSAWVYKIALNECRMRIRKQRRLRAVPYEEYLHSSQIEVDRETPERALAAKEAGEALHDAFQDLPEEQRTVILMKEYQGLKFHEIAEVLEVPLSTVKSRMYLGLKTLRRLMEAKS